MVRGWRICSMVALAGLVLLAGCVAGWSGKGGATVLGTQRPRTLRKTVTKTLECSYWLYLPPDYAAEERWPLVLFLHGAGERGEDLELVKKHGIPKLAAAGWDFPFIAVSPQCPQGAWWDAEVLDALLDEMVGRHAVDEDRVYATGLSMGGFGTWELLARYPERFAAAVPICGGGMPYLAGRFAHVPVWAFHGARDPVVPLRASQAMVDALKACGGTARLTVYPEAEHDSWTATYENPELYRWLLSHRRRRPAE